MNNMNFNWCLTEDLIAYVVCTETLKGVWISTLDIKKSKKNEIIYQIPVKDYSTIVLEDNNFDNVYIKLTKYGSLGLFIKDPRICTEEIQVYNIDQTSLFNLITKVSMINGKVQEELKAVVSNQSYGLVSFVHEGMKEYQMSFKEMVRQFNCSINKKTSKWIPGHRYDTKDKTYYYLGEFNYVSYKDSPVPSYKNIKLVCTDIKSNLKISEILKTRKYTYNKEQGELDPDSIIILDKSQLMVDSGEVLENDMKDIDFSTLWIDIINNAKSFNDIQDILFICGKDEIISTYPKELKENTSYLRYLIKKTLINGYLMYGNNKTIDEVILPRLSFTENFLGNFKYILKKLNIDLEEISKEILMKQYNDYLYQDLDTLLTCKKYSYSFTLNKSNISIDNTILLDEALKDFQDFPELFKVLKKIILFANNNGGVGSLNFKTVIGENNIKYNKFYFQIENILSSNIISVTDKLKEEILKSRLGIVDVSIPKDYLELD